MNAEYCTFCTYFVCGHWPCMDWMRFLTVSGRTLSAAHFSIKTGGMWLYTSRLSTVSGSKPRESINCLQDKIRPVQTQWSFLLSLCIVLHGHKGQNEKTRPNQDILKIEGFYITIITDLIQCNKHRLELTLVFHFCSQSWPWCLSAAWPSPHWKYRKKTKNMLWNKPMLLFIIVQCELKEPTCTVRRLHELPWAPAWQKDLVQ